MSQAYMQVNALGVIPRLLQRFFLELITAGELRRGNMRRILRGEYAEIGFEVKALSYDFNGLEV